MITQICAVRDLKADAFGTPFFNQSLGQAERSFGDEVNRAAEDNLLYQHPDDFQLFHLGSYDDSQGFFDPVFPPRLLASGSSLRK